MSWLIIWSHYQKLRLKHTLTHRVIFIYLSDSAALVVMFVTYELYCIPHSIHYASIIFWTQPASFPFFLKVSLSWRSLREQWTVRQEMSFKNRKVTPDIILVCEHDDGPGVGGLQEPADDLVEFPRPRLPRDLQRLCDTHTT